MLCFVTLSYNVESCKLLVCMFFVFIAMFFFLSTFYDEMDLSIHLHINKVIMRLTYIAASSSAAGGRKLWLTGAVVTHKIHLGRPEKQTNGQFVLRQTELHRKSVPSPNKCTF